MELQKPLITLILILILSILFIPQDRMDIVGAIVAISVLLGLVYWKIKK